MDIKVLIGMLNRPWFMEPRAAQYWGEYVATMFRTGHVPVVDKRERFSYLDMGAVFRVDENGSLKKDGQVQVIRINYPIAKYDYCGDPGTQSLQQLSLAAAADPTVEAIVYWIDSPGGQVDGTEAFANTIKGLPKAKVSYSDSTLASASYWIGSSCDEVIAQGSNNGWNDVIGSIGTMCMWEDRSGKYEKEGIKIHTVFATESKDKWGDYFEMNKGNYAKLVEQLDGLNDTFLNAVKTNRAGKIDLTKENVLTGKTYNAKQALKFGLIDKIGNFQFAVKRALALSKKQKLQTSISNNMAFPKTLKAANASAFAVIAAGDSAPDGGFLVTEQQMNTIEGSFAAQESAANTNAAEITRLTSELEAANAAKTKAEADLATANTQITSLTTDRDSWKAKADEYGKKTSDPEDTTKKADKFNTGKKTGKNSMQQYAEAMGVPID